jgi:hypothetical protein
VSLASVALCDAQVKVIPYNGFTAANATGGNQLNFTMQSEWTLAGPGSSTPVYTRMPTPTSVQRHDTRPQFGNTVTLQFGNSMTTPSGNSMRAMFGNTMIPRFRNYMTPRWGNYVRSGSKSASGGAGVMKPGIAKSTSATSGNYVKPQTRSSLDGCPPVISCI